MTNTALATTQTTLSAGACGTRSGYARGCRCRPCTDATAAYSRDRYRRVAYGTWQGKESLGPYRQKILDWRAQGVTMKAIAEASGLAEKVLDDLANGRRKMIYGATITALNNAHPAVPDTGRVDATGSRRRLQALMAVGWPLAAVAAHAGLSTSVLSRLVNHDNQRTYVRSAASIRAAYDHLWDRTPPPSGGSTLARQRALESRWPKPMAWDDDTMDDPTVAPVGFLSAAEPPAHRVDSEVLDQIAVLVRAGLNDREIGYRIGRNQDAVTTLRRRKGIRRAS